MKKDGVMGTCHICGDYGQLSEEHVPPRRACNEETVEEYSLEDLVTKGKARREIVQGGVKGYTLCRKCNSDTGSWYGGEFVSWADRCHDILVMWSWAWHQISRIAVSLQGVYPLRFLKQVVTSFFSVCGGPGEGAFASNHRELGTFVLEKYHNSLPSEYGFFLDLCYRSEQTHLRRFPLAGKISVTRDANGNFRALNSSCFSEISHPPFRLVMTWDGRVFEDATPITHFKDFRYDEKGDLDLALRVVGSSSPLPGSLR